LPVGEAGYSGLEPPRHISAQVRDEPGRGKEFSITRMKIARVEPFVIDVYCPHCEELVTNSRDSSYMWEVGKINAGELVVCSECNEEFKLPDKVDSVDL
jgi:hypothetical protein